MPATGLLFIGIEIGIGNSSMVVFSSSLSVEHQRNGCRCPLQRVFSEPQKDEDDQDNEHEKASSCPSFSGLTGESRVFSRQHASTANPENRLPGCPRVSGSGMVPPW
jgi:hypothetical protein